MLAKSKMPLWAKVMCFIIAAVATLYCFLIAKVVYQSVTTGPNYQQVCAPLHFIRKADYYNGRTFVVCGSPTTDPVLKEYLPQ